MEKWKPPPSAEELLGKIQEMEQRLARIKQEIFKLKLSADRSKHGHQRNDVGVTHAGLMQPLAMKLTETQYLNILQSMGQAVHLYHIKHGIIFWNRAAENLYGYKAAEVYGRCPTELIVEPKYALMADHLQERIALGDNCSGEFPVINKKGEKFVIVCADRPYRDEYGRQLGAICISSDSRQYQQTSTPSTISKFVLKVKSKLKTGENYIGHGELTLNQSEGSIPRIHLSPSPFEMIHSMEQEEQFCKKAMINYGDQSESNCGIREISYSKDERWIVKKGNNREAESIHSKLGHFGNWHRYNFNQAHEPAGPNMRLDDQLRQAGFRRIS